MSSLPIDLALTLAGVGVDINQDEDELEVAIRIEIGIRHGYFTGPALTATGYAVDLLYPDRQTFEGRTRVMAVAWCLVYLLGERGELGIRGFEA